jgi:guanylate kinase
MRSDVANLSEKTQICTIIWPSWSWKTTLLEKLFSMYQDVYEPIIITTTRPRRSYEKQWEWYIFVSWDEYNESENIINIALRENKISLAVPHKYWISAQEVEKLKKKSKIWLIACWVEMHDCISKIDYIEHSAVFLQISFLESINRMFKRWDGFDNVRERSWWFGQESWLWRNIESTSIRINNEIELTKERVQSIHNTLLNKRYSV